MDRFAFSVIWEVTKDGDVVNVDFVKSLIHSIGALTYQQAQGMIDQPDDETNVKASAVKRLAALARVFRARRIAAGALTREFFTLCVYVFYSSSGTCHQTSCSNHSTLFKSLHSRFFLSYIKTHTPPLIIIDNDHIIPQYSCKPRS